MQKIVEYSYGKLFKYTMKAINPFKKAIMTTECFVHKIINNQAAEILKNDNYIDQYIFFSNFLTELNLGVVWADQDFKSSGHFYNPIKERGLYGNTDALTLAKSYYNFAINYWKLGNIKSAMFFLGAAAHLVQDMTVPQHANIKLLKEHHKYEKFIRDSFCYSTEYLVNDKVVYFDSVDEYIKNNATYSIKASKEYVDVTDDKQRYDSISKCIIPMAQRSTAGLLLMFYKDVVEFEGGILAR